MNDPTRALHEDAAEPRESAVAALICIRAVRQTRGTLPQRRLPRLCGAICEKARATAARFASLRRRSARAPWPELACILAIGAGVYAAAWTGTTLGKRACAAEDRAFAEARAAVAAAERRVREAEEREHDGLAAVGERLHRDESPLREARRELASLRAELARLETERARAPLAPDTQESAHPVAPEAERADLARRATGVEQGRLVSAPEQPRAPERPPAPDPEARKHDEAAACAPDLASRIRGWTARAAKSLAAASVTGREKTLVALALCRGGDRADREVARRLLDAWWAESSPMLCFNYELAFGVSALEGLSLERVTEAGPTTMTRYEARRIKPDVLKRLRIATRALIEGRVAGENGGCAWTYRTVAFHEEPDDDRPATRSKPAPTIAAGDATRRIGFAYDNSNTQCSVLALHDAARGGIAVPDDVARGIAAHFVGCAVPFATLDKRKAVTGTVPVSFGYRKEGRGPNSMHMAGLSSLGIARELGAKGDDIGKAIAGGLACLPSLETCPDGYALYSIEKALDILGVREVEGRDWFAPLAEQVLAHAPDDNNTIETAFRILFLTRATISKDRIVDHRTLSGGASEGSDSTVYLPGKKKTVDAVALVSAYAPAEGPTTWTFRVAANEAVCALEAELHGRDACLLGPIGELLDARGEKREIAKLWLRGLAGADLSRADVRSADERFQKLVRAREHRDALSIEQTLREPGLVLPLRAFAANALATMPCPEAAPLLVASVERLADDRSLATAAGARCARSLSFALTALVRAPLPALARTGPLAADDLRSLARAAKPLVAKALDEQVDRALGAYASRKTDAKAWASARDGLACSGKPALERLLAVAEDPARAGDAFSILRETTGESTGDDARAWAAFVEGQPQ